MYFWGMFVRKKKNKSGSISVQIIDKSSGKYSVIKTIGSSKDSIEVNRLYNRALEEIPRFFNQLTLSIFDDSFSYPIEELNNDNIRVIGPEQILGKIFDKIGFNQIPEDLFRDLVISRITNPGSKLKLVEYLRENKGIDISVYSIYRYLDKISSCYKAQVEQICFSHTKRILDNVISVVFYDLTTIYFESSESDDFRIPGFSKDGKHQHPQIYLGLLVGQFGYPLGYDIFEGNIFEGHTLIPFLEHFQKKFDLSKPIIIADAGLLSNENISALQTQGYKYILGARIKNESERIKKQILSLSLSDGKTTKIDRNEGSRLIISYSGKRAKRDEANRKRGLQKLEKNLRAGKLTKSQINNRGYNKYLKLTGEINIEIDYDKFKKDSSWDGLKGYITNSVLPEQQVIDNYNQLWQIEKAFRISKTDLQIRPIYHRLKDRIETHICISFVAYSIYKEFERILKEKASDITINKAIESIKKMYEISVPISSNRTKTIRLKFNEIQEKIFSIVNIN